VQAQEDALTSVGTSDDLGRSPVIPVQGKRPLSLTHDGTLGRTASVPSQDSGSLSAAGTA